MSVRRTLFVLMLVTLLVPTLLFSQRARLAQRQSDSRNLQRYSVQLGRVEVAVNAIGAIEADQIVRLAFTTAGRVSELLVQADDYVQAGDILARLDDQQQRLAYDQAALSFNIAEMRFQDLIENPVDESRVRVAEASLDRAWGAYANIQNAVTVEDLRAAELSYQQAQAALDDAVKARVDADADQADESYLLLDAAVGAASFNAEIARLQLETLRNPDSGALGAAYASVVQAMRELDQAKAGPTQAELDRAEVAVRQAQAALDQAQKALDDTLLIAPFEGVVSTLGIEVGSLVVPGGAVVELTDISPLRVTVQVDEVDIRVLRERMPARIQFDALPGFQPGARVERIALVGENNSGIVSYPVELVFEADNPTVRVGMTAEAVIIVEERNNVLVVPNLYIRLDRDEGRGFVNVLREDGQLEEVEIQLGLRGQDASEVLSGLRPGDVIAIDLSGDRFSFFGDG